MSKASVTEDENGMFGVRVCRLLGVGYQPVIERVEFDETLTQWSPT